MNLDGLRPWGGLVGGSPPDVVVAGIAYDGSAVYRKGAALAPQRIRQLSAAMPPVTEEGHLLTGLRVQDIGDLDVGGRDEKDAVGRDEVELLRVIVASAGDRHALRLDAGDLERPEESASARPPAAARELAQVGVRVDPEQR